MNRGEMQSFLSSNNKSQSLSSTRQSNHQKVVRIQKKLSRKKRLKFKLIKPRKSLYLKLLRIHFASHWFRSLGTVTPTCHQ